MPAVDDDEDPLPSTYTNANFKGVDDDVDKCITEFVKEAHKQIKRLLEAHSQESKTVSHIK